MSTSKSASQFRSCDGGVLRRQTLPRTSNIRSLCLLAMLPSAILMTAVLALTKSFYMDG